MRVLMGVLLMLRIKVVLFCEEVIVSELDDMFCVFMRTVVVIRAREQLTDSVHRYDWPNPRRPLTDFLLNPPTSDSQTIHHVTKTPAISRDLRLDTSSLGHNNHGGLSQSSQSRRTKGNPPDCKCLSRRQTK